MAEEEFRGDSVPFKAYVDGQLQEVRRAAELALESQAQTGVDLREYVEAIWDEQRRGMQVAEQEREKAAKALRIELSRAIEEGDRALRDHIENQIAQIQAALTAAEKLEVSRVDAVAARLEMYNDAGHSQIESRIAAVEASAEQHVEQLRREREIVTAAQMEAIAKAETAAEKRFESVNEFRAQLADQTGTFVPREVHEQAVEALRREVNEAKSLAQSAKDQAAGKREAEEGMSRQTALAIGFISAGVAVVGLLVTVVLAANGAI